MLSDFLLGAAYAVRGCGEFCRDKRLWKYAVLPVCLLLCVYAAVFWGVFHVSGMLAENLVRGMEGLPSYLSWLHACVRGLVRALGVLLALVLLATSVGALYELFGGLFFDALTGCFEERKFGTAPRRLSFAGNISYSLATLAFALRSTFIILFFLLLSFFFPVLGQILLVIAAGQCMGISYMVCSGNNNGLSVPRLRAAAKKKRALVLGFGVAVYLMLMIPFAAVILLPGFTLGGSLLFNGEFRRNI